MPYLRDPFFNSPEWIRIASGFNLDSGDEGPATAEFPQTSVKNYGVSAWAIPNDGSGGSTFVSMAMVLAPDGTLSTAGLDNIYFGPHSLDNDFNGSAQLVMDDHTQPFPDAMTAVHIAIGRSGVGAGLGVTYSYELFAEVGPPSGGGGVGELPGVGCERPPWPYSIELSGGEGDWGVVRFKTLG